MANEIDLTTTSTAASALGIASNDPNLPRLITAASTAIRHYLGYDLHKRTGLVETVVSHGGPSVFLRAGQVTGITSITVSGAVIDPSEYVLESEFGTIRRLSSRWPFTGYGSGGVSNTPILAVDDGSISVTFDAGWVTPGQNALDSTKATTLPADIEEACVETVTALYRRKGRDTDVDSASVGDGSYSYGTKSAIPQTARALLGPYRKFTRRTF